MPPAGQAMTLGAGAAATSADNGRAGIAAPSWAGTTWLVAAGKTAFVLTVAYAGLMFWLAPYPPMADLPQHAAQVALLRELLFGQTPWEPLLRINYFTPYWIGYGLTLPLTFAMPVAAAMKLLLTAAFYAFVFSCVLLRRHFNGDERLDWLFIPGFFGFAYAWGFFTFLVAAPIGLLFILAADRYAQRPALGNGIGLSALGLILFFSHGLVFAFACAIGTGFVLVRRGLSARALTPLLAYVPLCILTVGFALAAHGAESALPNGPAVTFWDWRSRLNVMDFIFGLPYDSYDAIFAGAGVIVLWAPRFLGSSLQRARPAAFVPMAAVLLVWLTVPHYAAKTSLIYHRFAIFILPFYALMFCAPARMADGTSRKGSPVVRTSVLLACLCWVYLATHTVRIVGFGQESRDFDSVRAAADPGQRALALILDPSSAAGRSTVAYHHHALWYQAENGGFVDFNFAWYVPQIVRFRADQVPGVQPFWQAREFDWNRDRGDLYRYFFVRRSQPLPSGFFDNELCDVAMLKSAGAWSIYEVQRCRPRAG